MKPVEKPLFWVGSSRADLRHFPEDARRVAGRQLLRVQRGLAPNDWKPMPAIGPGVAEIRVHGGAEYRVLYIAKFREAVYVLHAFDKKTRETSRPDLELGRKRLAEALKWRQQERAKEKGDER